jgi:hypothetical protein
LFLFSRIIGGHQCCEKPEAPSFMCGEVSLATDEMLFLPFDGWERGWLTQEKL